MAFKHKVDGETVELTEAQHAALFPIKTQTEIGAESEAKVQRNTDAILQNDKKFRVVVELIFDTLVAVKTGNLSAFDGVTNKTTFRDHIVERFRNL